MRGAFTRIELLVVLGIIAILLLLCVGIPPPLTVPVHVLIGWVFFLARTAGEVSVDVEGTATFVVCLGLLAVGTHVTCRWLYNRKQADAAKRWSWCWTMSGLSIVVLAAAAGICAVAVTHQGLWLARYDGDWTYAGEHAAVRTQSQNNLKQMALAAHNFHGDKSTFPAGGTFDAHGRGMHGWQTQLLPYIEEGPLFKRIDLAQPWDSPGNLPAMQSAVQIYLIPRVRDQATDGLALSHYAGNVHVLGPKAMSLKEITDGTSNTILLGEAAANFKPWGYPVNWRDPAAGLNKSADGFGRPGVGVVQFAMADGSVRSLADTVSPAVLRALSTPAGGEPVPPDD